MKKFLAPILLTVLMVGAAGIAAWQPWASKEREHELEWLEDFDAWSDSIDMRLGSGDLSAATSCMESYETDVEDPPARLTEAAKIAVAGCRSLSRSNGDSEEWRYVRHDILADLTDRRTRAAAPPPATELAARAVPFSGGDLEAFCWTSTHWDELKEEWAIVDPDELWPIGFADPGRDRIHLAPEVCEPLRRFYGSNYAPSMTEEALDLAIALVTLVHEAEHLRSPDASEAAVECVAIQRIRDLVREAGRGPDYQELMAGLAWDVGYPDVPPEYRTEACHDGSELDVRPETSVWP